MRNGGGFIISVVFGKPTGAITLRPGLKANRRPGALRLGYPPLGFYRNPIYRIQYSTREGSGLFFGLHAFQAGYEVALSNRIPLGAR